MQIHNITLSNRLDRNIEKNNRNITKQEYQINKTLELPGYNQISFEGYTVPKDLPSFYQRNIKRMPDTLRKYMAKYMSPAPYLAPYKPSTIQQLGSSNEIISIMTPVMAHYEAFKELLNANNVQDIKSLFPQEPLFENLINPDDADSRRGVLSTYRMYKDVLNGLDKDILTSKENFTVYLVKKIFLECKTLDEINKDFEKDADPDFLAQFNTQEPEQYIHPGTLSALGINPPLQSYRQSLRYTDPDFAKRMGELISQGLRESDLSARTHTGHSFTTQWNNADSAKRTHIISDMMKVEQSRYTMIDAWNHSTDIILALSEFMRKHQIDRPLAVLYHSNKEFNEFQSKIMTEFWESYPDFAIQLGERIKESRDKIEQAVRDGKFEALKKEILSERDRRINFIIEQTKQQQTQPRTVVVAPSRAELPTEQPKEDYKSRFIELYNNSQFNNNNGSHIKSLPDQYFELYAKTIADEFPEDVLKRWIKVLEFGNNALSSSERESLLRDIKTEPPSVARLNRALEATFASIIKKCTGEYSAYELPHSDLKLLMYNIERDKPLAIRPHDIGKRYEFHKIYLNPKQISKRDINQSFDSYYKELSDAEVDQIIDKYFYIIPLEHHNQSDTKESVPILDTMLSELRNYIKTYGKSINIIFSDKSRFDAKTRLAFNNKFRRMVPESLRNQMQILPLLTTINDMEREHQLADLQQSFLDKYRFMSDSFLDIYFGEIRKYLRFHKDIELNAIDKVCQKRKTANDESRIILYGDKMKNYSMEVLAMEQALADVLYDVTGEPRVYSIKLEVLMDKLELLLLQKQKKGEFSIKNTIDGSLIKVNPTNRPDFRRIRVLYDEYLEEMKKMQKDLNGKELTKQDILYILNPYEEDQYSKQIYDYTSLRMAPFFN